MAVLAANNESLRVRKWCNWHYVPADHPAPERVRDRVDDALRRELGPAVASCLAAAGRHDESVVFVRRLELDWTVDAAWDPGAIARACALFFARDLLDEIATDTTGNVVRFASYAEYLATYLVLRARDSGAQPWCYMRFDGWVALPASAAIRSAVCEDRELGRAALAALSPDALMLVARALTGWDAAAIVAALAESRSGEAPALRAQTVLLACVACPPPLGIAGSDGLIVWLFARAPALDFTSLLVAARIIRSVDMCLQESTGLDFAVVLAEICRDEALLVAMQDAAGAGSDSRLRELADLVTTRARAVTTTEPACECTRHGGLFLLLDAVGRETLEVATATLLELDGTTALDLLTFVVLSHCLGGESWTRTFGDVFWRNSLRIAPSADAARVGEWLDGLSVADEQRFARAIEAGDGPNLLADDLPHVIDRSGALPRQWAELCGEAAARALRRFARRLPGFADASCHHLWKNFLAVSATVDRSDDRVAVTLSRPPLDLILRISGQNRGERRWPWLDARPFVFFSGE